MKIVFPSRFVESYFRRKHEYFFAELKLSIHDGKPFKSILVLSR